jgi:hypothetical protein
MSPAPILLSNLLARLRDPTTERLTARDRIAIALLPFTVPKLQATATVQLGLGFAKKLERAMLRSGKVRLVASEGKAVSDKPAPVFEPLLALPKILIRPLLDLD